MDTAGWGGRDETWGIEMGPTGPQPWAPTDVPPLMKSFLFASSSHALRAWAVVGVLLPALGAVPLASAAAPDAGKNRKRAAAAGAGQRPGLVGTVEALKVFDTNDNQHIDAEELTALQKSFGALKKLDANGNGEIEPAELERLNAATAASPASRPAARADERKGRGLMGLQEVDKNDNRQVDPEEVADLEKLLRGGRVMDRLDQNSNGKLEPDEVKQLNERLNQREGGILGALRSRLGGSSSPSARKEPEPAPANPLNVPAPIVPPRPEDEKPAPVPAPAPQSKPETKPDTSAPQADPKPPGGFGT